MKMTKLLKDFLEDPRPKSEKGSLILIHVPPPRRRIVLVPVLQKSSETQGE